jgi:hypothetical protein
MPCQPLALALLLGVLGCTGRVWCLPAPVLADSGPEGGEEEGALRLLEADLPRRGEMATLGGQAIRWEHPLSCLRAPAMLQPLAGV